MWSILDIVLCIISCIIPNIGGFVGSLFTETKDVPGTWYGDLDKPSFNPPTWVFLPAWTTFYILIGFAAFKVWHKEKTMHKRLTKLGMLALTLYAIQLVLNWFWTPIFFNLQALGWAFFEIVILWVFVIATTFLFFRIDLLGGLCMLPYCGWITFASILNFTLWQLNK
ncbi:CLUMA_CG005135, isoform A [Clunio marinus]|uniref:CLUMA_CG005135, isoform A n=1 Tax=Clunio marinus TaxID=568069 RepID=A0A1J1HVS6_9DIPT|nr:CLUMA_CG005135, isoform A [Clunio marinus]